MTSRRLSRLGPAGIGPELGERGWSPGSRRRPGRPGLGAGGPSPIDTSSAAWRSEAAKKSSSYAFRAERMIRSKRGGVGGSIRFRRHQSRAACLEMVGLMVGGKDIPPQPSRPAPRHRRPSRAGTRGRSGSVRGPACCCGPPGRTPRRRPARPRAGRRGDPGRRRGSPSGRGGTDPSTWKNFNKMAKPSRLRSVRPGQQLPLVGGQRPVLGEFLLVPVSFHDALSISHVLRSQGRADGTPSEGPRWGEGRQERGWAGTS